MSEEIKRSKSLDIQQEIDISSRESLINLNCAI